MELPVGSYVPLFHTAELQAGPAAPVTAPAGAARGSCGCRARPGCVAYPFPRGRLPGFWFRSWWLARGWLDTTLHCARKIRRRARLNASGLRLPRARARPLIAWAIRRGIWILREINSLDPPKFITHPEPLYFRLHYSGLFARADVITLTHTAATLETQHKAFRVLPASSAGFAQLREGPHRADRRARQRLDAARDTETALRIRIERRRCANCRPARARRRRRGQQHGTCRMRSYRAIRDCGAYSRQHHGTARHYCGRHLGRGHRGRRRDSI